MNNIEKFKKLKKENPDEWKKTCDAIKNYIDDVYIDDPAMDLQIHNMFKNSSKKDVKKFLDFLERI